jgi:HTH-type transcriptional regulator / antitoxin HigA
MEAKSVKSRTIFRPIKNPEALGPFVAPRSEDEYNASVARLNELVDEVGDNPDDPRYRLIETLSVLIEKYDEEHYALPDASPVEVVRFLMEQHDLRQSDLPQIGSQGVVSEILSGRRELNVNQIQALCARFRVGPAAFLPRTRCTSRAKEA